MSPNRFTSWSSARVAMASVAVAGLAVIAACTDGGVVSNLNAPSLRFGESVGPSIANATLATVCVSGPAGTYTFVNSAYTNGASGTTTINAAVGVPYSLIVNGGNPTPCVDVLVRTSGTTPQDAFSQVTVTQTGGPAGSTYNTTNCVDDPGVAITSPCANPSTIHSNVFHGSKSTFVNVAPTSVGCTYTFGWYKNQGNGTVPTTSFFGTAWTWRQVLAFKGQGNLYYTLADQYIPAKLNIGGGSAPPAVAQAIIDAQTFFTGRALGSTTGYTATTLNAITKTLNDFNDGLVVGWPHC